MPDYHPSQHTLAVAPEHAERPPRQVRVLDQCNILCSAEGDGNVATKLLQRLCPSNLSTASSPDWALNQRYTTSCWSGSLSVQGATEPTLLTQLRNCTTGNDDLSLQHSEFLEAARWLWNPHTSPGQS